MSARKLQAIDSGSQNVTVEARQIRLTLSPEAVVVNKSGIEFRSAKPFSLWTEMTVSLDHPQEGKLDCNGVVVACTGNRHRGYRVVMVFTGMSKQSESRLNALAYS